MHFSRSVIHNQGVPKYLQALHLSICFQQLWIFCTRNSKLFKDFSSILWSLQATASGTTEWLVYSLLKLCYYMVSTQHSVNSVQETDKNAAVQGIFSQWSDMTVRRVTKDMWHHLMYSACTNSCESVFKCTFPACFNGVPTCTRSAAASSSLPAGNPVVPCSLHVPNTPAESSVPWTWAALSMPAATHTE